MEIDLLKFLLGVLELSLIISLLNSMIKMSELNISKKNCIWVFLSHIFVMTLLFGIYYDIYWK